ncbi:MAG TPA: CBS domain-containing protein [Acetobacteraceae bacterium]|nr:CBS domain-containing protein [Acetobacteraceae bacterium]
MFDETVVTARELMTRDVAVVHPDTSLMEAVRLMAQRGISGLPVVDDAGTIVGMLTEGDLVRWHEGYSEKQARWLDMLAEGGNIAPSFLADIRDARNKVKAVMSTGVVTVSEETPAREVAHLMTSKGIKRVPVLRDGRLVGIVARADLVRALAERFAGMPEVPEGGTPAGEAPANVDEALRRRREETLPGKKR